MAASRIGIESGTQGVEGRDDRRAGATISLSEGRRHSMPPPAPSAGFRSADVAIGHFERMRSGTDDVRGVPIAGRSSTSPSPSTSTSNRNHARDSHAQPGRATPMGYYMPPPGYADPLLDPGWPPYQSDEKHAFDPQQPRDAFAHYGGHGRYREALPPSSWSPFGEVKNAPALRIGSTLMPSLSHHDWTIPQAKQILSHWATLATLLGGVQATLLTYYNKNEGNQTDSLVYRMVISVSCAGLFLEVYGALLAAGTIVASISLQSRQPPSSLPSRRSDAGPGQGDRSADSDPLMSGAAMLGGVGTMSGDGGVSLFNGGRQTAPLSPRATAVLDRLTVLVGFLIPLGAVCELVGLAGYAAHFQGSSVAVTMVLTLAGAILSTFAAGLLGLQAGSRAMGRKHAASDTGSAHHSQHPAQYHPHPTDQHRHHYHQSHRQA